MNEAIIQWTLVATSGLVVGYLLIKFGEWFNRDKPRRCSDCKLYDPKEYEEMKCISNLLMSCKGIDAKCCQYYHRKYPWKGAK